MKDLFLKKFIKSQAPGVSDEEIDKILKIVNKNPALFKKIAEEMREKMSEGKEKSISVLEVMEKYKSELEDLKE